MRALEGINSRAGMALVPVAYGLKLCQDMLETEQAGRR